MRYHIFQPASTIRRMTIMTPYLSTSGARAAIEADMIMKYRRRILKRLPLYFSRYPASQKYVSLSLLPTLYHTPQKRHDDIDMISRAARSSEVDDAHCHAIVAFAVT